MKALVLSSLLAAGLVFASSAKADTQVYNSKTSQNVSSIARSSGGAFDGTYLSSKGDSLSAGPTVAVAGKTAPQVACSRRAQMSPETCARHCSLAQN